MRVFIAVEIAPDIRQQLGRLVAELARTGAPVKWVEPGAMHLTLKFIGEAAEGHVARIKSSLDGVARIVKPCRIVVGGTGVFPDERKARVLWVGVEEPSGELAKARALLEDELSRLGVEKEGRGFTPHLTLGRVRVPGAASRAVAALRAHSADIYGEQLVDELVLFQSILRPAGAEYRVEHRVRFG